VQTACLSIRESQDEKNEMCVGISVVAVYVGDGVQLGSDGGFEL